MARERVGPAHMLLGDPTVALGAGMTYLGETRDTVIVRPNVGVASTRTDQRGRQPRAGGDYAVGPMPEVQATFVDEAEEILGAILPGAEIFTSGALRAVGFGAPGVHRLAAAPTLAVIEQSSYEDPANGVNGIEAAAAFWLPSARLTELGEFRFSPPPDAGADDALERVGPATFMARSRVADQSGTSIPAAARMAFKGPPGALGLAWSLPVVGSVAAPGWNVLPALAVASGMTEDVTLSAYARDPAGLTLTYDASSDDTAVATVAVAAAVLTVTAVAAGTAMITVTADNGTRTASATFVVTVT